MRTLPPADELEQLDAQSIFKLAVECYQPKLKLACSFQKEESVLLHLLTQIDRSVEVFALDTGLLFAQTYATWEAFEHYYGITIKTYQGVSLAKQVHKYGDALWEREPSRCCELRKVLPLREALAGSEGWIVGIRREQSPTRANTQKIEWDKGNELWRVSPLADWDEKDVWSYIHKYNLPYNKLHDQGYASIGCTPCTAPGEGRSGRWAGNEKTECGLHGGES